MKKVLVILLIILIAVVSCTQEKSNVKTDTDKNGFEYKTVEGDPFNVREYQLENGLKVFLSENKEKPEISTMIAVRAGSTYDPSETTGLAHYLEHLMFKGSSNYGTVNWEAEEKLLKEISDQFEKHKATTDLAEKKEIYTVIDSLSQAASKYAVFNEYKKMVSSLGATGTNAFTSNEKTVYINTIPSNQMDKWLTLESERFSELVLRLFHTELETVYEEFNTSQSSDYRRLSYKFNELLFPTHPYGTQTTLGRAEHLKNPSMVNIHNYWDKYYVANNMAVIMVGDLDFDETIVKVNKHFSSLKTNDSLTHPTFPKEEEILSPVKESVIGPEAESIQIGFRTEGSSDEQNIIAELVSMILSNGRAGLIDIDLVKKQKVLNAYAYNLIYKDYGSFVLQANPLEGQTLEEAEQLLLAQIEKLKTGDFEDWLQDAIINNEKLSRLNQIEYNYYNYMILEAFTLDVPWADAVSRLDKMEKITKQQIIDYANKTFKDNYVVVYKRNGENTTSVSVDKPTITALENDRTKASKFYNEFLELPETQLKPDFVDYKSKIEVGNIGDIEYNYIQNKNNELTSLNFIFDMGSFNQKELEIAFNYFSYAGTEKYSAEELAKEYFKKGVYAGVSSSRDQTYIGLYGLDKEIDKALELFIENIKTAKVDAESFAKYIDKIKKQRANNKLSKQSIQGNLISFVQYGKDNPAMYQLTNEELDNLDTDKVIGLINNILEYEHKVFYFGPKEFTASKNLVSKVYTSNKELKPLPEEKKFIQLDTSNKVYFTNYDMVQCSVMLLAKDKKYNEEYYPYLRMFNEFYGIGMSSVVTQELRESKGLVYSAYAYFSIPSDRDKSHYLVASIATQPDKIGDALKAQYGEIKEVALDELFNY
ncbi:MAG: hypothetical protein B6226_02955 [Candidatus Cloacimonetes bacterium 4572_65]|nr:MAG: hypothetical protein B6226_02955 [Candidatus Cloacimonetes bacterium 4572_65]